MGLFRAFQKVTKAAIDIAVLPVEVVKDAATLGGMLTGEGESYSWKRIKQADENLGDAYDAIDEDD